MRRLIVLGALIACTNSQPCGPDCPAIEGVWFLQYVTPDVACDGGTIGAAPAATMQFTREGSVIRSVVDGIQVSGTLYDTFDFSMNGVTPGGGEVVSMRGAYKPASHTDAGDEQLVDGRLSRSIGSCDEERRFTGARY